MARKDKKPEKESAEPPILLRVTSPFMHRGKRVFAGDVIECTREEADGALFKGWGHLADSRYNRRDMRARE